MGFLSETIKGPYAGIMILAAGILISVFAGFSKSRKINLSMAILNAVAYAGSFYIYIRNFLIMGTQSNFLVSLGLPEIILSCIMLFCGLNVLLFICLHKLSYNNLVRTMILLSFFLIATLFLVMSDNAVIFIVSVILTMLSIYNLLASLEKDNTISREYISKFGMRVALPAALILFGYSLLAGTGRIRALSAYSGMENTGDPIILIGVIVFASAVYLHFFLYPFQSVFLKLSRRVEAPSLPVLWSLYIPACLVLLIKLDSFFRMFSGAGNFFGSVTLAILAFISLFGAGLGAIRSKSIKRILSMFILFQLGLLIFIRAAGFTGGNSLLEPAQYGLLALLIIPVTFLPLSMIAVIIERAGKDDSIDGTKNLIRRDPYTCIFFILIMMWWLAANVYVFIIKGPTGIYSLFNHGTKEVILVACFVAALLLILVNVIRLIILFFRKAPQGSVSGKLSFPRVFYVYISFFAFLLIASLVLVIIGKVNIGQDHINIWGNTFYIFSSGN